MVDEETRKEIEKIFYECSEEYRRATVCDRKDQTRHVGVDQSAPDKLVDCARTVAGAVLCLVVTIIDILPVAGVMATAGGLIGFCMGSKLACRMFLVGIAFLFAKPILYSLIGKLVERDD